MVISKVVIDFVVKLYRLLPASSVKYTDSDANWRRM